MRLNRKQSYIRISNVPPPAGQRMNWGKYVYFGLLLLILAFVAFYLVRSFLYIEGTGQVIIDKLYVQHTADIRLVKILVKEGDKVKKGDPLFSYADEKTDTGEISSPAFPTDLEREHLRALQSVSLKKLDQKGHQETLAALKSDLEALKKKRAAGQFSGDQERERLRATQALRMKEVELGSLKERLEVIKSEYAGMKRQVVLETYLPDQLRELSDQMSSTQQAIKKTGEEIAVLTTYLKELEGLDAGERALLDKIRAEEQALKAAGAETAILDDYLRRVDALKGTRTTGRGGAGLRTFLAPQDGVVTRIYQNDFEVALKGTTMMEIYKPEAISIKGFFDQEYLDRLRQGNTVVVKFPDGTTGSGVISNTYFATVPLPQEFQKKYEPIERSIAVDIVPQTQEDAMKWKNFYKLSVTLYVKRGLG